MVLPVNPPEVKSYSDRAPLLDLELIHIRVAVFVGAILLLGSNPASDAAMIAMDYGKDKIIKADWKKVLTDESLHEVLAKMLKLDKNSAQAP